MKFNRLTVVRLHHTNDNYQKWWECRCDCGATVVVFQGSLRCGDSQSCGCFHAEKVSKLMSKIKVKHGHNRKGRTTREYTTWVGMWTRCTNPKYSLFRRYGGRGIKVCERWRKFENFLADMGPKPKGMSIGRIDNDGDYEPSNCCWETPLQQSNNTRRSVRVAGKTIRELSESSGIKKATLYYRRRLGCNTNQIMRKKKYGTLV